MRTRGVWTKYWVRTCYVYRNFFKDDQMACREKCASSGVSLSHTICRINNLHRELQVDIWCFTDDPNSYKWNTKAPIITVVPIGNFCVFQIGPPLNIPIYYKELWNNVLYLYGLAFISSVKFFIRSQVSQLPFCHCLFLYDTWREQNGFFSPIISFLVKGIRPLISF